MGVMVIELPEHTENDHKKILSAKRATKQVRKTKFERMVEKEEDSLLVADSAASHV
ncbi:hypothetical protein SESBI_20691 [Sesbania bispinosa]|nr:hypothetical protein SESBI_20691 [Sesbania bispinosa]